MTDSTTVPGRSFTPGPWRIALPGERLAFPACSVTAASGRPIATTIYAPAPAEWRAEDEAIARLIAAAPELLDVCEMSHEAIDILMARLIEVDDSFRPSKSGLPWKALLSLTAVIAKATKGA